MKTLSNKTPSRPVEANPKPPAGDVRSHQGSLRSKLVLSLAAIFFVFLMIDEVVRRRVIEPEFVALEQAGAIRDANRVLAALNSEVEHLSELASHWAAQIREWELLTDTADGFTGSAAWPMEKSDWAAQVGSDGTWTWIRSGTNLSEPAIEDAGMHLRDLVQSCRERGSRINSGMTRVSDHSLVMFAIVSLDAPSSHVGELARRFLIVARHVDDAMLANLCGQTQVEFSIQPAQASRSAARMLLRQVDQSLLTVDVPISGINGEKVATVAIRVARDITARSSRTTKLARNSFIFGSVAALIMLLVMLQRIVIGPLAAIREHSNRVAQEGFDTEPLLLTRNDEIGQLASAFDKMVDNLREAQSQLARASQAAGRSQVASTVIHNVGNVLTNVNSLLDAATAGVDGLRIGPLDKLARRLRKDSRNEMLLAATPDYLEGLAGSLNSDQDAIRELLSTLHDNICHIHDVIRDQQRHTEPNVKSTRICVKEVLEEAIACCRARLDDDMIDVELAGSLGSFVRSDRTLLLQTMINIVGNARHAMRANEDRSRILAIDVTQHAAAVRILFRDNGCGMTEETAQRVFDAHFTTRESGTGLGLHFCALTLKRLGGSIRVVSDGPELGSTFVIELPRDDSPIPVIGDISKSASTNICVTTT